jgi:hypothetical protein
MQEITLTRPEFLVLLDALGATAVVGLDPKYLRPASTEELRQLVVQGLASLEARGLLRTLADDVKELNPLLVAVVTVVTEPVIALISMRDLPGTGRQLFLHYQNGAFLVEQTLPAESLHRLATLANQEALFTRLLAIFPVEGAADVGNAVSLPQAAFLAAKDAAERGQPDAAVATFTQHGMSAEAAQALTDALTEPTFSGTIALLRCNEAKIIDARNPAILQGRQGAWSIAQFPAGAATFQITPLNAATFRAQLTTWFAELASGSLPTTQG